MLQQRAAQRSEAHVNTRESTAHEQFVEEMRRQDLDRIILRVSISVERFSKSEGPNLC